MTFNKMDDGSHNVWCSDCGMLLSVPESDTHRDMGCRSHFEMMSDLMDADADADLMDANADLTDADLDIWCPRDPLADDASDADGF